MSGKYAALLSVVPGKTGYIYQRFLLQVRLVTAGNGRWAGVVGYPEVGIGYTIQVTSD